MIVGEYWKLHDDATIGKIDAAAVRLLTGSGVRVEHEGLGDMLEAAGCRIDRATRRCRFPEKLIRQAIAHLGGRRDLAAEIPAGWSPTIRAGQGGNFPHLLEWPSGRRRLATRRDVVDMAKMAHALDEFARVGKVLTTCEVDHRVEPLWNALQLAQITDKPIRGGEIHHAAYIQPLVRMGEVLTGKAGDTSLLTACDFFIAPLILDPNQAACFLAKRRVGLPNVPGTMPSSTPITPAATTAPSSGTRAGSTAPPGRATPTKPPPSGGCWTTSIGTARTPSAATSAPTSTPRR